MEIKPNSGVEVLAKAWVSPSKAKSVEKPTDAASFEGSAGLRQALADSPEVRTEAVERAKKLVAESSYPPPETIKRLSNLLALNLDASKQS